MAHFMEHMVFMGSKKYPKENDFDAFIKKHAGSDNASTECEHTTYYFEIQEEYLEEGMDRFAQFFIAPLMKREAMTRERESIESEFQMSLPSHFSRKQQLLAGLAQGQHPATKFTWGNLKTLQEDVSDDELYNAVHEFKKRHYSAHRMTLALQARLPLSTIEEWTCRIFNAVPNNGLPPDDFKEFVGKSFDTPAFHRLYRMDPIKDVCQLELSWAMPSQIPHYRSKPVNYISSVIAHEGRGTLLAYLRSKVWALELYHAEEGHGFENNSMHSLLHLTLVLTENGYQNLPKVLEAVFSYIRMMQLLGPSERMFDEIKAIEDTGFRFLEETSAVEYIEEICENMQYYPPQDYITGPRLYFDYNDEAIEECLNAMAPDKVNIIVSAKDANIVYDQVEPWFGTRYTVSDIPTEWVETWKSIDPYPEFTLPEPNMFLTKDFSLKTFPDPVPPYPVKVYADEVSEVWYRPDVKFKLPHAFLYYMFLSNVPIASPVDAVAMDLFVVIMKQLLEEEVYPAEMAHLSIAIFNSDKGMMLKLEGYNEKLQLLLETIVQKMNQFEDNLTEELFQALKEEQTKSYYNSFLKPIKLVRDLRFSIVLQTHWTAVDKHAAIAKVTLCKVKEFSHNFRQHVYIQSLVQGNYTQQEAIDACKTVVEGLGCHPLLPNTFPEIRVSQLPLAETFCCVKSFNSQDSNSVITNYYQSGPHTLKDSVIVEIILLIMEEPMFDQLRTKEQLGYSVYCMLRDTHGIMGYSITVSCQEGKNSTKHVNERIEAFIKRFSKVLKKMPVKEVDEIRETLIKMKQQADLHLKEEVSRNWEEILSMEYMFDRLEREVDAVKEVKASDVRKWFDDHTLCGNKSNLRKLSTQIIGHVQTDTDKTETKKIWKRSSPSRNQRQRGTIQEVKKQEENVVSCKKPWYGCKTEFPLVMVPEDSPNYISDIETFKRNLFLYPLQRLGQ